MQKVILRNDNENSFFSLANLINKNLFFSLLCVEAAGVLNIEHSFLAAIRKVEKFFDCFVFSMRPPITSPMIEM
jgi:hypothetical protein